MTIQAAHSPGSGRGQGEGEPAAIPVETPATQTPSPSLDGRLQAIQALAAARSLVRLSTPAINKGDLV